MMALHEIAFLFFGVSYTWGGNDAPIGFDCSGLVCECLRTVGKLDGTDLTAQGIYDKYFPMAKASSLGADTLLFFGASTEKITHVAIAISRQQMIEAGGEGRVETDKGYVRIRPITNRSDLVAAVTIEI